MIRPSFLLPVLFFLLVNAETAAALSKGPVPYRNQFPLALLFFSFESDSAYIEEKSFLRSEINYSAIFEKGDGKNTDYFIDMELARTRVEIKGRVNARLQLEGEITHIKVGPGFLDGSIRTYHRLLGVHVGSSDFPDNAYVYSVNGREIHLDFSRPGSSISDTALKIKLNILKEKLWYPAISLKWALKFPTGGSDTFAGSGSTDFGVSLLLSKRVGRFILHFNFSATRIFSSGLSNTVNDPVIYQGMAGFEWGVSNNFSISFQLLSHKYPFSGTGIKGLDNLTLVEVIGFKYAFNGFQLDFGFVEDTSDINFSPDFSILFGITFFSGKERSRVER